LTSGYKRDVAARDGEEIETSGCKSNTRLRLKPSKIFFETKMRRDLWLHVRDQVWDVEDQCRVIFGDL